MNNEPSPCPSLLVKHSAAFFSGTTPTPPASSVLAFELDKKTLPLVRAKCEVRDATVRLCSLRSWKLSFHSYGNISRASSLVFTLQSSSSLAGVSPST